MAYKKYFYVFCIFLFCNSIIVRAQSDTIKEVLDGDILENITTTGDDVNFDFDTYTEQLVILQKNPLNLNKVGYDELLNTHLLNEIQVKNLFQHIKYYGPLLNVYELQTIPEFDMEVINRILPYVKINTNSAGETPIIRQLYAGDYQYFFRIQKIFEQQAGYSDDTTSSHYLGNNERIYMRFKYNFKNTLSYGITVEKDPGEELFGKSQPQGFDYISAHFYKRGTGFVRALALGDYQVSIGQGLMMWTGFAIGKSVYPLAISRSASVLNAYTSVNENRFLRGAGITVGNKNIRFTAFGSYKKADANISLVDTVNEDALQISSIENTGLHRTENELADKDAINETIGGFDLSYANKQSGIGIAAVYNHLSQPLVKTISPYEIYDFEGNKLINAGIHYNYVWRNFFFFGETAMSDNKKFATLNGLIIAVDAKVDIAILYRNFDKAYQTLYASTFSENTIPQNEQGTYAGVEIKPVRSWKLSGYIDVFKHPWLEYLAEAPSYGTDVLAQITFAPNKSLETYFRIKNKITQANASSTVTGDIPHDYLSEFEKMNIRWNLNYKLNASVSLRSRIEYTRFVEQNAAPANGYVAYQDVIYNPMHFPLSLATRIAFFNTDNYDTRIYTYESDVLYAYSIVGLYGKGIRSYITLQYSPFKWLDVWFRIAGTVYSNQTTIGTALDQITGSKKTEGKFQLRLKW